MEQCGIAIIEIFLHPHMAVPLITIGDRTSHGGAVVSASTFSDTDGKPIARVGDQVTCPKKGRGANVIASGDPTLIIDGKPAARHGDKTACGATLIASQFSTLDDPRGAVDGTTAASARESSPSQADYDERVQLEAATIEGIPYFIETSDGRTFSGRAASDGLLPRVGTTGAEEYRVYWGDEALAKRAERD